ncbi:hypothetical protein TWF694_006532 [Orbilia ellipsospora]|uniref:DUF8035 domain-containing protein n=1 Tax=Orbilia ellipsospora TaxID=2528407 RepID=A0AAV9XM18_9PEZI
MANQAPYGYYGNDFRSKKQPASQNPYRASTGNAAGLYGGGAGAGTGYNYRDIPDDWSSTYYGDDFTDDSVSEDFQRISISNRHAAAAALEGRGRHQQPPQQQHHQHPQHPHHQHPQQKLYSNYAANVAAGRAGGRSSHIPQSHREPSPTDSSYSQTTTSASTYAAHHQHVQQAAAYHAHNRQPSKSLDRLSHYLPRGYRLAGPYQPDDESVGPDTAFEERSRGVMVPARTVPRNRSVRRQSSPEGRNRDEFLGKLERELALEKLEKEKEKERERAYYAQAEKAAAYRRSLSQDRNALRNDQLKLQQQLQQLQLQQKQQQRQERQSRRESRGAPGQLARRSSSIGRLDSLSLGDQTDVSPHNMAGALVRRSKSVGAREALRRRRSLGPINTQIIPGQEEGPAATAVRLDLGGRDVDISVNDRDKRRAPAIGSITINQHSRKDGEPRERGLGAPSESGRTRTTAMTDREREYEEKMRRFHADLSSSPPTSPEMDDEYARMERKFNFRQPRPRSASLGTPLTRRTKVPLQIAAPPGNPNVGLVPATPGGTEPRHTRISRKIVTRHALESLGYQYEDTGDTFTVFEVLQPEQIDELMDMTARIRAARHDRRRERSRGDRQFAAQAAAGFGRFDEYGSRKAPAAGRPLRPIVNQEPVYREPPTAVAPMPGAWPTAVQQQQQIVPERRNIPMPDYTKYQRAGPSTLGGPPVQQQQGRRDPKRYYL